MPCHRARFGKGTVLSVPPPLILILILILLIFDNKASQEFAQKSPRNPKQQQRTRIQNKEKSEFTLREANSRKQMTTAKIY
jgi:hypothetical protein